MAKTTRRVGVVLFQLGGPDSLAAIEPFLYNLFCDPDIIDFPFARIGRKPLAKLISAARSRKVQHHYATIGGASPIRRFTERQARALEAELAELGLEARCFVAMRYWHPFTAEAVAQLRAAACDELVLLPLYPQYSSTTTGSSLNEWRRLFDEEITVHCVEYFYRNEMYLDSLVEKIDDALARFPVPARAEIVFSAHSVPMAVIALAAEHVREVCVVPISFVSDHVETLGEIDHEAREEARRLGISQFEMSNGLNDSPKFIQALSEIVLKAIGKESTRNNSMAAPESNPAAPTLLVAG